MNEFVEAVKSEWALGYWDTYVTKREMFMFGMVLTGVFIFSSMIGRWQT